MDDKQSITGDSTNNFDESIVHLKIELSNYAYQIDRAKRDRDNAEAESIRLKSELDKAEITIKEARYLMCKMMTKIPINADNMEFDREVMAWLKCFSKG